MTKMRLTPLPKRSQHRSCYVKELTPMHFFDGNNDHQSRRGEYARLNDMVAAALADFDSITDTLRVLLEPRFGQEFVRKRVLNCIYAGQDPGPLLDLFELDSDVRSHLQEDLESINARLIDSMGGMKRMRYGHTGFPTLVFVRAFDPRGALHSTFPFKESSVEPDRSRRVKYIGSIELVSPVVDEDDVSVNVSVGGSGGGEGVFSDVDQRRLNLLLQQMDELLFLASTTGIAHGDHHGVADSEYAALATEMDLFQQEFGEEVGAAGSAGLQICAQADFEQDPHMYAPNHPCFHHT
jgi:hypothetical protein